MSSLFSSSGASIIFLSKKFSDSTSNLCPVTFANLSQCRSFMALLAISSRRGQHSLKSSIFFFNSLNACHSFKAFGSFRHLRIQRTQLDFLIFQRRERDHSKYLLSISDVRGQALFFGPPHGSLVLVCGSKILVT